MVKVNIREHHFKKTNLVTTIGGSDNYICEICGMKGVRRSISEAITVSNVEFKKGKNCRKKKYGEVRILRGLDQFGLLPGIYKTVDCPGEHANKFLYDVWVYSEKRKEPVRLLFDEYEGV